MSTRERITVYLILSLGAAGSIASAVRFKFIPRLIQEPSKFFSTLLDLGLWSMIELGLGIIAGSLSTLRPLFRKFFRREGESGTAFDLDDMRKRRIQSGYYFPMSFRKRKPTDSDASAFFFNYDPVRKSSIGVPVPLPGYPGDDKVPLYSAGSNPGSGWPADRKRDHWEADVEVATLVGSPESWDAKAVEGVSPLAAARVSQGFRGRYF